MHFEGNNNNNNKKKKKKKKKIYNAHKSNIKHESEVRAVVV